DQRQRAQLGKTHQKLAVCFVLEDRCFGLKNDRTGIERGHHSHYRDACLGKTLTNRSLNRCCAPQRRQQGRVDVQCPPLGEIDDFLRQKISVSDDHRDVGLEFLECVVQLGIPGILRLKYRNLFLDRDPLDRRRSYLARSSLWLVRPSHHTDDLESFSDECAQRWRREFRSSPEDDPHYISVSWWCSPFSSVRTLLIKPGYSAFAFSHFDIAALRLSGLR